MTENLANKYVYAIDIGGTNVRLALISCQQGRIIDFSYQRYPEMESLPKCLGLFIDILESLTTRCNISPSDVIGTGICFPGLIDRSQGVVVSWPNKPKWNGFALEPFFHDRLQIPVVIEEDANAIALAEMKYGQYGTDYLLSVAVGTGIGSGLVKDGKLFRGLGWSGELGHIRIIPEGGPVCVCGQEGCLQALAAGPPILREARLRVRELDLNFRLEGTYDVARLAHSGQEWAIEIFREVAQKLAIGISNAIRMYDVNTVILGGGVMEAEDLILEPLKTYLKKYLAGWPRVNEIRVEISKLGSQGGIFGATAVILDYFEKGVESWNS